MLLTEATPSCYHLPTAIRAGRHPRQVIEALIDATKASRGLTPQEQAEFVDPIETIPALDEAGAFAEYDAQQIEDQQLVMKRKS